MKLTPICIAIAIFAASFVTGCYAVRTVPLEPPIARKLRHPDSFALLPAGEQRCSIGDVLFTCARYKDGAHEEVGVDRRPGTPPFPDSPGWSGTHQFTAEDGAKLTVFTHPEFYKGKVGVILDGDDMLATSAPLVQVEGSSTGRRWALESERKFFYVPTVLLEVWGVRFGGKKGSDYVFEIIDRPNPNVTEVVQSLQVAEAEFLSGFVVRGVMVDGISDDGRGIISYVLTDMRDAKAELPKAGASM